MFKVGDRVAFKDGDDPNYYGVVLPSSNVEDGLRKVSDLTDEFPFTDSGKVPVEWRCYFHNGVYEWWEDEEDLVLDPL